MATVNITRIKGDPNNVRTKVLVKPIEGLADSIREVGLQQPIVVRPHEDGYMVIAGHRRLAAIGRLVDAGQHTGELEVDRDLILRTEDISEADVTVAQLVENLQREDIDVLDEAAGYMRLLEFDMSQADIARKVGRSRAHVTKRLALLSLPEKAQKALTKGDITIERALDIAALDTEDQQTFCEGDLNNIHALQRILRSQKGKKVAASFAAELETGGLTVHRDVDVQDLDTPEGQHYETMEVHYASGYEGTIPGDSEIAIVTVAGEDAMARIYKLVDNETTATSTVDEKRAEAEKVRRREERAAEQAKTDFLTNQLAKVKAGDAQDIALSMALDRLGASNAAEFCRLLDLEVAIKEESTYDGGTRNVKQYVPAAFGFVKEARANGDIGNLRRAVLAIACTYGYKDQLLERFGFDPSATEDDA
jgi:ParB/RepB/Spo0J family partition protein